MMTNRVVVEARVIVAPSRNKTSKRATSSSLLSSASASTSGLAACFGAPFPSSPLSRKTSSPSSPSPSPSSAPFPFLSRKASPSSASVPSSFLSSSAYASLRAPSSSSSCFVRNLPKSSGGGGVAAAASGGSMFVSRALRKQAVAANEVVTTMAAAERDEEKERVSDTETEEFVDVAHKLADAAGEVIRQFFRTKVDILDKEDLSPVTIADRQAEQAMTSLIKQHFPQHGIYGEESGVHMPLNGKTEYVWVLDPIDGTKSFITGKPLFGTLIALVHKGVPILGIIDQPVIRERWVGVAGRGSTLNGEPIASRSSTSALKDAYLYTTSPHLFGGGSKEEAFTRVREKVKCPLYGCDCYAYGLLSAGHADLVIESGLKPYDYAALIPVIEGAGGHITDWEGKAIRFWPNSDYPSVGDGAIDVMATGSAQLHKAALAVLDWK